jgi:hypothetical protein
MPIHQKTPNSRESRSAFTKVLTDTKAELEQAIGERDRLNIRIAQLQNLVRNLAAQSMDRNELSESSEEGRNMIHSPLGLTEAVRTIFRSSPSPLHRHQLKNALTEMGYDLTKYANPMAIIYQIEKRLHQAGEIVPVKGGFIWHR